MFRLAGPTCLAGDVIGDYDFDRPLQEGDLVLLGDMAIYTTCKNNTFNGMPLPNLWKLDSAGGLEQLTATATTPSKAGWAADGISASAPTVLRRRTVGAFLVLRSGTPADFALKKREN